MLTKGLKAEPRILMSLARPKRLTLLNARLAIRNCEKLEVVPSPLNSASLCQPSPRHGHQRGAELHSEHWRETARNENFENAQLKAPSLPQDMPFYILMLCWYTRIVNRLSAHLAVESPVWLGSGRQSLIRLTNKAHARDSLRAPKPIKAMTHRRPP